MGVRVLNPLTVPLLNTLVLLRSGVTITWSHHALIQGDHRASLAGLVITIFLGVLFSGLQYLEYLEAAFTIRDSVFGRVFFLTTGFHGFHVLVGSVFLLVCAIRIIKGKFSSRHHLGFECAAWYWHFVDVV